MKKISDQPDGIYAVLTVPRGEIILSLEYEKAPLTVANFVGLAEGKIHNSAKPDGTPFYDGLTFHRVIPNFMIQGGDPQGNGQGGPGYSFADEFDPSLKFDKPGILAMANSGPATNGSQFFITHVPTAWLNGKHSIFGHVVTGQQVVDSTKQGDKIISLVILRKGKKAQEFDAPKVFAEAEATAKKKLEEQSKADEAKLAEYKKKAKTTPSGLMYIIENEGTGRKPAAGDTVSVNYAGYLLDGKKFDSSFDRGQPISFPLGVHRVIPGWDEGIALFKEGGKGKLIIPGNLAYGAHSPTPLIPPNATLVFDIELVKITPPNK